MVARAQARRPASAHPPGSVVYALSAVLVDNLPTDGANPHRRVVRLIENALSQLRQGLGSYANQVTFIPMPVLFMKVRTREKEGYVAATANVVNGVLFANGAFLFPSPGNPRFMQYVKCQIPTAVALVEHWDALHCRGGGLHCATAARRVLNLPRPWWEMMQRWE
jgi:hypothetical protein